MTPYRSNKKYIGIDPGKSGGLVVISESGEANAYKCPDKIFDMAVLFRLAIGHTAPNNVNLLMERVWARPGNAVRAAFTYGVNYGQWLGIAASHEIKMYTTLPNAWIKWVGCPKALPVKERKHWLRDKAKELYPDLKKVTLATADAILIGHYAKEEYFNEK
jgi:hypothetical protein